MSKASITGKWRLTLTKKRFLLAHDIDAGVTIIASYEILTLLFNFEALLSDGTFKSCPSPYEQLYVLYGIYEDRCLPLVFGLLSGKSACQYRKFFQIISKKIKRLTDHRWVPQIIVTDYERGIISALESHFPKTAFWMLFSFHAGIFQKFIGNWFRKTYCQEPG